MAEQTLSPSNSSAKIEIPAKGVPGKRAVLYTRISTGDQHAETQLYDLRELAKQRRMLALGKRADVPNAHPHRSRDTLAVDMLRRGASPYDVAKMLGDTIDTVERHYTPFVKELRDRVRNILNTGVGIEEVAKMPSEPRQNVQRKPF